MNQRAALSLRVSSRVRSDPQAAAPQASEDMAAWLQEVARRPWVTDAPLSAPAGNAEKHHPAQLDQPESWHGIQNGRELVGLAALTAGWLQYYFLDTMVQINCLPMVVIFVPLGVG